MNFINSEYYIKYPKCIILDMIKKDKPIAFENKEFLTNEWKYICNALIKIKKMTRYPPNADLSYLLKQNVLILNYNYFTDIDKYLKTVKCDIITFGNVLEYENAYNYEYPSENLFIQGLPEYIIWDPQYIFKVFTDGACTNNGKSNANAGYAAIINNYISIHGKIESKLFDENLKPYGSTPATNNRGEMFAMAIILKHLYEIFPLCEVIIVTDSKYCINTFTLYLPQWKLKNITDKKNMDLINYIDKLTTNKKISYEYQHALHGKHDINNENQLGNHNADILCKKAKNYDNFDIHID